MGFRMTQSPEPDDMGAAYRRMADLADQTQQTNRQGWTDDQWVQDARQIMDHPDGSTFSLLNGHILALLREAARLKKAEQDARDHADQLTFEARRHQQNTGIPAGNAWLHQQSSADNEFASGLMFVGRRIQPNHPPLNPYILAAVLIEVGDDMRRRAGVDTPVLWEAQRLIDLGGWLNKTQGNGEESA
jgi:hypothetical protein